MPRAAPLDGQEAQRLLAAPHRAEGSRRPASFAKAALPPACRRRAPRPPLPSSPGRMSTSSPSLARFPSTLSTSSATCSRARRHPPHAQSPGPRGPFPTGTKRSLYVTDDGKTESDQFADTSACFCYPVVPAALAHFLEMFTVEKFEIDCTSFQT